MTAPNLIRRAFVWREFATREALAQSLAAEVAATLSQTLADTGSAALAVSGGRTPTAFFEALSRQKLDWAAVEIALVDERWVDANSDRSNTRSVRQHLLRNEAVRARFIDLKSPAPDPETGLAEVLERLAGFGPLTAAVLGMGEDGHTASLFPHGDRLAEALRPDSNEKAESIRAPEAGEPRITLTAAFLAQAGRLFLHIEGPAKRQTFFRAVEPGPVETMPIRAFLQGDPTLEVFWRE